MRFILPAFPPCADRLRGRGGGHRLVLRAEHDHKFGGPCGDRDDRPVERRQNTPALYDGNFGGVAGRTITVVGGNAGNNVNPAALTGANRVLIVGGTGTDTLHGVAGADRLTAMRHATMTGGAAADVFVFETPGLDRQPRCPSGDRFLRRRGRQARLFQQRVSSRPIEGERYADGAAGRPVCDARQRHLRQTRRALCLRQEQQLLLSRRRRERRRPFPPPRRHHRHAREPPRHHPRATSSSWRDSHDRRLAMCEKAHR